jgi:hypothetical protein
MISVAATQASQKQKPVLAAIVQNVSVTTQGSQVNWSVQIPESQLESATQLHQAPGGRR